MTINTFKGASGTSFVQLPKFSDTSNTDSKLQILGHSYYWVYQSDSCEESIPDKPT